MSGPGFWSLATILGMSEVKLGSPGFYKHQKAVQSQDPEIGHEILDPSGGKSMFFEKSRFFVSHISSDVGGIARSFDADPKHRISSKQHKLTNRAPRKFPFAKG